jgi:hypothetical protein
LLRFYREEYGSAPEPLTMGVIPLTDVSRRPTRFPLVTASIIGVNVQ